MSKKKSFLNKLFGTQNSEDALIEQLFTNIITNDYSGVQELLEKNTPLNKPDTLGRLPIHLAVIKDRFNMIGLLKAKGADLNQRNEHQLTPLMLSIKYNALDTAKELLENGADPYLKNLEGKTAEQIAKDTNNVLFISVLNEHKKNSYQAKVLRNQSESLKFDKEDKDFNVLLEKAQKRQQEQELENAIQKKKRLEDQLKQQKNKKLDQIEAAYQAKLKKARELANEKQLSTNCHKAIPGKKLLATDKKRLNQQLWKCIKKNDADRLTELLKQQPSLETVDRKEGWTLLTFALAGKKLAVFDLLLKAGAQVNTTYKGNSILYLAVKQNNINAVNQLLAYGANPNLVVDDFSPLELALQNNFEEMVMTLLKQGAQVNYCGKKSAPMLVIIKTNAEEYIKPLVEHGLDVNQLILNRSPLEWCVLHNNTSIFKALVNSGANINIGRETGNALICKIVISGRYWFLKLMIELQADLNVLDTKGRSPLEIAIVDNEVKIVKSLLAGGASVQLLNADQLTPLQVARRLGRKEIIRLLE